jgi:hypothetical protein
MGASPSISPTSSAKAGITYASEAAINPLTASNVIVFNLILFSC